MAGHGAQSYGDPTPAASAPPVPGVATPLTPIQSAAAATCDFDTAFLTDGSNFW